MNEIIIDENNFSYLVRPELKEYLVRVSYGIPKKSKKGFVGTDRKYIETRYKNEDEASMAFHNYREEWLHKFYNNELVDLRLDYDPITVYYVTCPNCGKDAEIIDWVVLFGTDFPHIICCRHCASNKYPTDILGNQVGYCAIDLMKEEGNHIRLSHPISHLTWETFLKEGFKHVE